jgi:uncharacterized protein (TIGR03083 family)
MKPAEYVGLLRDDGAALVAAARVAPGAPVPSCPDWDMTGLVSHVSVVHHWVAEIVRTGATERIKRTSGRDRPVGTEATLAWYGEGLTDVIDVLERADPDHPVWNWFDDGPAPTRFWHRRMALETAAHRWDAQAAAGRPEPVEATLAVDGIDEYLGFVSRGRPGQPIEGLNGSLHLHATDVEGEWSLDLAPDHIEHRREHSKADAALRGTASDLWLWLLNRQAPVSPPLELFGNRQIIEAWRQLTF